MKQSSLQQKSVTCLLGLILMAFTAGCAPVTSERDGRGRDYLPANEGQNNQNTGQPEGESPQAAQESMQVQVGKAAYYADALHGKPTASGELYDRNQLTAAHPSLPFGTICRVTNLENGKSVEVRINDRCAGNKRILDLSFEAAYQLDALKQGVIEVKLEILRLPK